MKKLMSLFLLCSTILFSSNSYSFDFIDFAKEKAKSSISKVDEACTKINLLAIDKPKEELTWKEKACSKQESTKKFIKEYKDSKVDEEFQALKK